MKVIIKKDKCLELLFDKEMDQKQLAIRTGLSNSTVNNLMKLHPVSLESAKMISQVLGSSVKELFELKK